MVLLPSFSQNFEQISKFDPATGSFTHYVGNPKFDDFTELDYGAGYQVYCKATSPVTVSIKGKLPTRRLSKSLSPGWHLLGSTTLADTSIASWLAGVDYSDVREHNVADNSLPVATQAKANTAYYVNVRTTSTWTPPLPKDVTTRSVYDGDGGRVKQITAAGTTTYLGEVYEKDASGKTTKYVFAGDLRIAAKDSAAELRFYHTDHLGSSNVVTNATGQLVELTEHSPYGAVSRHEGTADVAHKFTGQRLDAANGLILFPARAYDPELGRFLQADPYVQDPADPQTLNRYAYVRNNPVNLVDPSGYGFWKNFFRIVAIVAAVVAVAAIAVAFTAGFVAGFATSLDAMGVASAAMSAGAVANTIAVASGAIAASSALAYVAMPNTTTSTGTPSHFSPGRLTADSLPYDATAAVSAVLAPIYSSPDAYEEIVEQETLQDSWSPFDFIGPGILGGGNSALYGLKGLGTGGFLRIGTDEVGSRAAIVIGESMKKRVIPYAKKVGARYYRARGRNPKNYLRNNYEALRTWVAKKKHIIDIGPDKVRRIRRGPSPNYEMETHTLRRWKYPTTWDPQP